MAELRHNYRKTKSGVLCTIRVSLPCGHNLREDAQGRTEATAKTVATRLIMSRIRSHVEECKG